MKNIVTNAVAHPIGTRERVVSLKLDPAVWPSCSPPSDTNAGCACYDTCSMPHRGEGVQNHAFMHIKSSNGKRTTGPCACFAYETYRIQYQNNGDVYEIIADEGDTFPTRETEEVSISGKPGKFQVKRVTVDREVLPFPPAEEWAADAVFNQRVMEMVEKRQRKERLGAADLMSAEETRLVVKAERSKAKGKGDLPL
jgi:hypothetical protein